MARTIEDVLARRTPLKALLLDATAAEQSAEKVATLMAKELLVSRREKDLQQWQSEQIAAFKKIAVNYQILTNSV